MKTIVVTGGRHFEDKALLETALDKIVSGLHQRCLIVQGGATGADQLARHWAIERGNDYCTFDANWSKFGRAAGPIRNESMLRWARPDLVVAFPGGRGTANMVQLAREAGVEVREVS